MYNFIHKSFILMLLSKVYCESSTTINEQLQTYKRYVNASLELEKQDKSLIDIWTKTSQVKAVNVTSYYRLQMTRHKEHNFKRKVNEKWRNCLNIYNADTKKPERLYFENENECLMVANSQDKETKLAVTQIEKEIRKWRKSYRYLNNLCHSSNPDDEKEAGLCLVQYMQRDNYSKTFPRLLVLKLEAMANLYSAINSAMINLEHCLESELSEYLEKVRSVMETLNKCYSVKT